MSGNAAPAEAPAEPTPAPGEAAPAPVAAPVPISTPDPSIPENARQAFFAAAQRHQSGDNAAALKLYMRALDLHPQFPDAYNNIGVILRAQEKLPAAAACFRRALSM